MGVNRHQFIRSLNSRWFALADLGLVSGSAALWYSRPRLGALPLLIALLPWLIRLTVGRFPFRRTPFDIILVVFLITAAIGVVVAYDREIAWAKFWLMVGAVLFYFALAGQPKSNLWLIACFLSVLGFLVACLFLLAHDWGEQPAKFDVLNRIGVWWMALRPTIHLPAEYDLHPNGAAGIMVIMSPFVKVLGLRAWDERRSVKFILVATAGVVVLCSLLMTSSRGAWLALIVGVGVWLLWGMSDLLSRATRWHREILFRSAILIVGCALVFMVLAHPYGILGLLETLPGPASAESRLELAHNTLDLIADYPFTGGGLGAFPGLYSHYVLVIPFFYLIYSHNLFLDVSLEQGLFGLFAIAILMLGSVWLLVRRRRTEAISEFNSLLRWSTLTGLMIAMVHSLVSDVLYGNRGTPILFLFSGLAVAVTQPSLSEETGRKVISERIITPVMFKEHRQLRVLFVAAAAVLLGLFYSFRKPLLSSWYANLGAVQMARVELTNWPTGKWDEGHNVAALRPAESLFTKSLTLDANNRTAHHRLGLIGMLNRNFSAAISHLERAFELDPEHRGIRKSLGYSYTWSHQLDRASVLLADIPEAGDEMRVYVWWWGMQGRDDLAGQASQMADILHRPSFSEAERSVGQ